jgi:hypothetical protein
MSNWHMETLFARESLPGASRKRSFDCWYGLSAVSCFICACVPRRVSCRSGGCLQGYGGSEVFYSLDLSLQFTRILHFDAFQIFTTGVGRECLHGTEMKWKVAVGIAAILIALAVVLVCSRPPQVPIQVSGGLTEREVSDICASVRRSMRSRIFPDLSRQSLVAAPRAILEWIRRPRPEIWKVEARNDVFVAVTGRFARDNPPCPRVFWGVFKGTNGWRVELEYNYTLPLRVHQLQRSNYRLSRSKGEGQ